MCEAEETEVLNLAGQRVHLPADRHALHLQRHGRQNARQQIAGEIAIAKQRPAGQGSIDGHVRLILPGQKIGDIAKFAQGGMLRDTARPATTTAKIK